MTCRELVNKGAGILSVSGIENAANEAEMLLCFLMGFSKTDYILNRALSIDEVATASFMNLINSRTKHVPLQYILHTAPFLGMDFTVGEGVLVPRPETEELTQICIDRIRAKGYLNVIDLCSGSGCIGISIARCCPQTEVWLLEKYDEAIAYLKRNVPYDVASRVHIVKADILTYDPARLPMAHLIVSNPPYIPADDIGSLQAEVQMEPRTALDGGKDGLIFYHNIASRWVSRICPGGCLALECGETQTEAVAQMLHSAAKKEIVFDMFGLQRFVIVEY